MLIFNKNIIILNNTIITSDKLVINFSNENKKNIIIDLWGDKVCLYKRSNNKILKIQTKKVHYALFNKYVELLNNVNIFNSFKNINSEYAIFFFRK